MLLAATRHNAARGGKKKAVVAVRGGKGQHSSLLHSFIRKAGTTLAGRQLFFIFLTQLRVNNRAVMFRGWSRNFFIQFVTRARGTLKRLFFL